MTDNVHHTPRTYPGLRGESWLSYPELVSVMSQLPTEGTVIEVGTASGATAAVLARSRPRVSFRCLDIFTESSPDSPPDCADRLAGQDRQRNWFHNSCSNMVLICKTLQDAIACGDVDLAAARAVLIDGDHTYEGVAADLAVCAQELPPLIFCHDYDCPSWPGIKTAVDEFLVRAGYVMTNRCNSLVTLRPQ